MWFYLYLNDFKELYGVTNVIRNCLGTLKGGSGRGTSEAVHMFPRLDGVTGGIHYYFSPGAKEIAERVGAKKCAVAPFEIRHGQLLVSPNFVQKSPIKLVSH